MKPTDCRPFPLPDTSFLNDLFSIGILRITEGLVFAISVHLLVAIGRDTRSSARSVALLLTEISLVLFSVAIKQVLVGAVGSRSLDALLVLAALRLFLRAGLLLRLVQEASAVFAPGRSSRIPSCGGWDVGSVTRTIVIPADAVLRLERGEFRQ